MPDHTERHAFEPLEEGSTACKRCPFHERAGIHSAPIPVLDSAPPSRISRHAMFLEIVQTIRKRSSCVRGQVGVVIVRDARIIAMGYNGAPRGMPQCDEVGCDVPDCNCLVSELHVGTVHAESCASQRGCQRSIHAELNAIAWAARAGTPTDGCTMYSTHSPCKNCAQAIVAAGITRFIFINHYRAQRIDILADGGVKVDYMGAVEVAKSK